MKKKTGKPAGSDELGKKAGKRLLKAKHKLEEKVRERTLELESTVRVLHDEIIERKKAEEEVLQIAKGVSAAVGEKFFYSLIEHLARILEADYAYVAHTIKVAPNSVRTLALYADGRFIDNIEVDLTGTPCDTVREKTCCYASGVQGLFPQAKTMALMKVEGYAGTPLYSSTGEWLGIMAVMYRRPIDNDPLVRSLLQIFAARAAAELERKEAEEALLNYKNQLQAVKEIGALANSTLNIEGVLQNILAGAIKAAGASAGMIFIKSSDNTLRWGASIGLSEGFVASFSDTHIKPGEGLTGRIFQAGAPIYIERDSSHDPRVVRSIIKDEGLNSFMGVPVFSGDEVIGVLNLVTHQPEVLAEEKLALVSSIGTHVGSAIRNALLFRERQESENALRKAKDEIERWNNELERRVKEYTDELIRSHEHLVRSEKLSAMGQMAAGLAHELNSPLAGLLPMIEKYRNEAEKGSRAHTELSIMLRACGHMAKIVRDFSMFSRESGGEYAMLNLNEIIDDTLSFSAGTFNHGKIQLIKRYDYRLPAVMGEKTGLQQVVLNMIRNAFDAMPEGGELVLQTLVSEDQKSVAMEFIDKGSGIPKEDLNKIFDPFFTTKRPGKGTGLGLSVSYNIIEKHGGRISVVSEPGKGTKFSIHLPAVRTDNIAAE